MTGLQRTSLRWSRFAEELVTSAIGILSVLAATAGHRYLGDRAVEREVLRAFRAEFAADVTELHADQESRTQKLASIDAPEAVRTGAVRSPLQDTMANALLEILDHRLFTAGGLLT